MRNFERLITLIALSAVMVLGYQNCSEVADTTSASGSSIDPAAFQALQTQAMAILANRCASCHNGFQENPDMTSIAEMRATGYISPGRPEFSPVYNSIPSGRMPPGFNMWNNARPEVDTIYQWILYMR